MTLLLRHGLSQMINLGLCALLSKNNFVVNYRYANYCESKRIVSGLNTAAAAGTMVGGAAGAVAIVFPLAGVVAGGAAFDAGYWWLVATRIDANNHGRGVYIEMTWALLFDITPQ